MNKNYNTNSKKYNEEFCIYKDYTLQFSLSFPEQFGCKKHNKIRLKCSEIRIINNE